jgi:hypothetical protein
MPPVQREPMPPEAVLYSSPAGSLRASVSSADPRDPLSIKQADCRNSPQAIFQGCVCHQENRCWSTPWSQPRCDASLDSPRLALSDKLTYFVSTGHSQAYPRQPFLNLLAISRPFHSLFKVLFIFPSRYLFAIGLSPIFSLR